MTTIDYERLYINGAWTAPESAKRIAVHSPTTEGLIGSVPEGTERDIDNAVAAARPRIGHPHPLAAGGPARPGARLF